MFQQFFGKVAMRIEQGEAVTLIKVLDDHVPQKRGFSRTRLTDDVGMLAGILGLDSKSVVAAAPAGALADVNGGIVHDARASFDSENDRLPGVW